MVFRHRCIQLLKLAVCTITIILTGCQQNQDKAKSTAPLFNGIGNYHHTITTKSSLAQRYFDQGLVLLYSFEYGESIRSFRAAIQVDSTCAMCYWGLALALGSKTDAPLSGNEYEEGKSQLKLAQEYVDHANAHEQAYINALQLRYAYANIPNNLGLVAGLCSSYSAVSGGKAINYASAMKMVAAVFPNDPDAKTLYTAALFDVTEWNFWDQNGAPNKYTDEIEQVLEDVIKQDKLHPGANHLYVHLMEFSPNPLRSLASADRLHNLVPISEHMAHMPCHTYYKLGRYHDAVLVNQLAIKLYEDYAKQCQQKGLQPETQYLYYHNYDYLIAALSMEGRQKLSIATANEFFNLSQPLVNKNSFLQRWLTLPIVTLARFGQWQSILNFQAPPSQFKYALGIWHYAQGLAAANLNKIKAAQEQLILLNRLLNEGVADESLGKVGHSLLQIASLTLHSIIANNSGDSSAMIADLTKASLIQDNLNINDPPIWYFPIRQLLATALLQQKKYQDAKMVYLQDLKEHPDNGWSLYGLKQIAISENKNDDIAKYDNKFKEAWKYADIKAPVYPISTN